jgi:GTP-binding protein
MKHIRNIAVIAHVDHGKTTLVDAFLKQSHVFRDNQDEMQQELLMDSNELERERGITIMAKNCAISYQDYKINIIDTPGHADFSGEVERTLGMAEGALLIVDAQEGPMPQTRFVLKKALELNLKIIVVINKIDKKFARVDYTLHRLSDLFLDLATHEDQLDFPTLFSIGRQGKVFDAIPNDLTQPGTVIPLLDKIVNFIPEPTGDPEKPFQMLVSALDYDNHLGRILIGKIAQGKVSIGARVVNVSENKESRLDKLMVYRGMERVLTDQAEAGDIIAITGLADVKISQTVGENTQIPILPAPNVAEPTIHMVLGPNTSPFAAVEGQFTTSRQIEERLTRELENNVGLKVEKLDNGKFKLSGRGELHLAVLLETMRREGYEMEVAKPEVITKHIDGIETEPIEEVDVIVPKEFTGMINQEFGVRQAMLKHMEPVNDAEVEFIFTMPTRALLGLRSILLTQTKGTVVMSSHIADFQPMGAHLEKLRKGALISASSGKAVEYGLRNVKGRGVSFITIGTQVYEGMIIGQNAKGEDIEINVCKEKNLTNHRSKSHQGITQLAPDIEMSLEQAIDFLEQDELLEITPLSLRLRKKLLTDIDRRRERRVF